MACCLLQQQQLRGVAERTKQKRHKQQLGASLCGSCILAGTVIYCHLSASSCVSGGELFDYAYKLDHLPEAEAAYFMQQLASFLAHAHAKNIAHR